MQGLIRALLALGQETAEPMTKDQLAHYGTLLLGERWQRPLSRLLNVDDRLVRRWASGERPIPGWVHERLRSEVAQRIKQLQALA